MLIEVFPSDFINSALIHKRGVTCPCVLLRFITWPPLRSGNGDFKMANGHALPISTVLNGDKSAPVCECGR